ncbi:hypothetical protein BH23BAC1_BH23BAC1_18170 [soil metagenome]
MQTGLKGKLEEPIKILLIDDDEVDRLTLKRSLKKAELNYQLTEYHDAFDRLKNLDVSGFDCIFLDYYLPGTDGLLLLKNLRRDGIKTPIIIITSQGDEKVAVKMMKSGASDYLVKDQINEINIKKIIQHVILVGKIDKKREATEEALKISEARLSEAQRIAKIGSWEYDLENDKFFWSKQMFRIFELDCQKFKPTLENAFDQYHPEDRQRILDYEKSLKENPLNLDVRILMPDGTFKYANLRGFYQANDPTKFSGTLQDITYRKEVEQKLTEAKLSAEESEKVKEQFLANMSHEIRTPLNAIIGYTRLLLKNQENFNKEQGSFLHSIRNAGENLLAIINDILDLSKLESGKFEMEQIEFDLFHTISSVFDLFKAKAQEKNIKLLEIRKEDVPCHLIGDPVRLNQILSNLFSNSLKFTEKGHIKLEVKALRQSDSKVLLQFIVEDTGIGIAKNKLLTIFDSFTQAGNDITRKYGGTGLGLTIVKKFVDLQQGEINVESELEVGTTFIINIPYQKSNNDTTQVKFIQFQNQEIKEHYPKQVRVLMAEDNEMNQEISRSIFKDIGWDLDIAENGLVALKKLKENPYDIILMDIQMPELNGYEATLKIRNEFQPPVSDIPIMAITAHALNTEIQKCLKAGMNDCISKPFHTNDLVQKVSNLLKDRKLLPAKIEKKEPMQVSLPEQKPSVINFQNLRLLSGNNSATVYNIIEIFLKETPERIESIQYYIKNRNWKELKSVCHKMKSSYAIIGALDAKKNLEAIELDCINKNFNATKFNELINQLIELNSKVIQELEQELMLKRI